MKKVFSFLLAVLVYINVEAQLLVSNPSFITESTTNNTIVANSNFGNKGLLNSAGDIYVHIGLITSNSTSASNWKYVLSTWVSTDTKFKCTALANNQWSFTIPTNLRTYFNITDPTEKIIKIAILFRDATGNNVLRNADGSDMFIPVYDNNLHVRFDKPTTQPLYVPSIDAINKKIGDTISIAMLASANAQLNIYYNDTIIQTAASASTLSSTKIINKLGVQKMVIEATVNGNSVRDSIQFMVIGNVHFEALPAGVKDGMNYHVGDTSVTLVVYAPNKYSAVVVGDFNNWTARNTDVMNMTPDSTRFWITLNGLQKGVEYAYQYIFDGSIQVADYNTTKILDPNNDAYIPASVYPNLKTYPTGKTTGIVSVLQTGKPAYTWTDAAFVRPNKKNLIIYELLIRDFVQTHNFQTLKDTLAYFKKLGVNAIELMPITEFEGNSSWGYNTNFFFATDKYYGTETAIKDFVNAAHAQGIAVIMDIVMNHVLNSSPLAQMYWDGTTSTPASNNPWLNKYATHPFNVGNDLNHEYAATKQLVARVARHWLTEFHIDGYRWDLSKGFTQKNNPTDVNAWGAYDASRIAIWKTIYDTIQNVSKDAYCILEHFADNTEEKELADYGMLLWGNANYNFNQATMGYTTDASFASGFANARTWNQQHLVTYMESHDEERLMYKNTNYGNSSGAYTIKDLATGLKRNEMAAAFWALTPGPKLIWQFGELGYDYSINACTDGTINNNCRLSEKPIKWDYLNNSARQGLLNAYTQFLKLRNYPNYLNDFISNKYTFNTTGLVKTMQLNGDSIKLVVVGNFDVTAQTATVTFPSDGVWYSLLNSKYQMVLGGSQSITLQAGEYYVFANKNINNQLVTGVNDIMDNNASTQLQLIPNPVFSTATLQYNLSTVSQVNAAIFDINGKKVYDVYKGTQGMGPQTLHFSVSNLLGPGVYTVILYVNNNCSLKKFITIN